MLKQAKNFVQTTVLGGIIVILPTIILIFAFRWLFGFVSSAIAPLTNLVIQKMPLPEQYNRPIATLIALTVIVIVCFLVGLFVRTRLGQMIYGRVERGLLSKTPGYKMVKETVGHFLGGKESPFNAVALVQIYQNETLVTAFITDRHADGIVTVFVPTGPNPTSGFIYHIHEKYVHPVKVGIEDAMRSVISCGAGSGSLIKSMREREKPPETTT